jgi:hypothetical protein
MFEYIKTFFGGLVKRIKESALNVYDFVVNKKPLDNSIKSVAKSIFTFVRDIVIFKLISKLPKPFLIVIAILFALTVIGEQIRKNSEIVEEETYVSRVVELPIIDNDESEEAKA